MRNHGLAFVAIAFCILCPAVAKAQQKHALLVGVTQYSDARMNARPLKYPEADATSLADVLNQSEYKVTVLIGRNATQDAVRRELGRIQNLGDQDGVLVLGFFGHGVQYGDNAYYCPYNTTLRVVKDKDEKVLRHDNGLPRQEPDPTSMVTMREMLDALALSPAGNKLLLADCCREDPSMARGGLRGRAFGSSLRVDQLPKNCAAMFACSEGEQAFEHDDWKHGAFTRAILNSLTKQERVTANGLSESVYLEVEMLVKTKGERQRVNSLLTGGLVDLKLRLDRKLDAGLPANPPMTTRPAPNNPSGNTPSAEVKSYDNGVGGKMILIPAGTFMMGSPESDSDAAADERPQHRVTLTRSFYMGETEVTQGQWKAVMGTEPWKGQILVKEGDNYPATYVSWDEAVEFCKKLSAKEDKEYRLPTEAEWEYGCRGGTSTKYIFGDDAVSLGRYGWFADNAYKLGEKYAHEVKQKLPNAFGLYDMHGNVWELCSDGSREYSSGATMNPVGPADGGNRVNRGGGWDNAAGNCRSADRFGSAPSFRDNLLGFRLVSVSQ